MTSNQADSDKVESNAKASIHGIASSGLELIRISKPPVEKIRKYGAEKFSATTEDDLERHGFWLENTIRVFDELSCSSAECVKCAVSLLKDSAYQWWNTLISIVSRDQITWEFFQTEFRKKYIIQRFLDQKRKEFLELKQGRMSVSEYKREFVRLSKYSLECILTETTMCKRFEEGLNKYIKLLVGILKLKEFLVLVDRAHKADELSKEKRHANYEARDSRKRPTGKSYQSVSQKEKNITTVLQLLRDILVETELPDGLVQNLKLHLLQVFGSLDLYLRDCPEKSKKEKVQTLRPSNTVARGRPPRNLRNVSGSRGVTKDSTVRSEARVPARDYAIRTREDPYVPDVIISTFSIFDTDITALIDPGSTHSYVYTNLVTSKNLPIESIEFVVQNGETVCIKSDSPSVLPLVISAMSSQIYVRKGCNAYLVYVLDSKVSEYPDVFVEFVSTPSSSRLRHEGVFSKDSYGGFPVEVSPERRPLTEIATMASIQR
ncbi:uncharacterized protein LOC128036148 [Gossypium raimondii]|uniref:uncharacterized protein LOC128036148 n=1 Tax=Gossypium raimondii TaxID=29730 RepID=UPI00227CC621|nr:uncharacterized protein LOC128036148 [Gossypium raimondii]